jgi:hypothetical protein
MSMPKLVQLLPSFNRLDLTLTELSTRALGTQTAIVRDAIRMLQSSINIYTI